MGSMFSTEWAFLWYLVDFCAGFTFAVIGTLTYKFAIDRFHRRLVLRLNDIEDRLVTLHTRSAANKRWDEDKWLKEASRGLETAKVERFDNDPR